MTRTLAAVLAAALVALSLSACGGGGGGGSVTLRDAPATDGQTLAEFRAATRDEIVDLADDVRPFFSSVAVATTALSRIDTSFDGQRTTVALSRPGKSPVTAR